MGAQLSLLAQTAPSIAVSSYVDVLDEVHYQSQLNSSRFLKTCKALDPNGEIVVKVFLKPTESYDIQKIYHKIEKQSLILRQLPNVLNYSKILHTDRAGYLIRQHMKTNLYDRLSLRPFLHEIELKFMAFQLLHVLSDIHIRDIAHGDIKTENIMVTSSNWLVLTDFSEFIKPKHLPEDNPGEYAFYFDTSQRRTCYLAPERFNSEQYNTGSDNKLDKEMDIFSLGCCIFELFTEGRPLFNLSQIFKYKNGEDVAGEAIRTEIKDPFLQALILDMVSLNPKDRLSARTILTKYRGSFFPEIFYSFMYEYIRNIIQPTVNTTEVKKTTSTTLEERKYDMDALVTKMFNDFPKICSAGDLPLQLENQVAKDNFDVVPFIDVFQTINGVGRIKLQKFNNLKVSSVSNQSALVFLSHLLHCIRNLVHPENKERCLEMILTLSQYISDSNKLDRVLPYVTIMLFDEDSNVKALAIKIIGQLLLMVESINRTNVNVFVDFILPRLNKVCQSPQTSAYVRMVLANCLGQFATTATKFHELSYLLSFRSSNIEDVNKLQKVRRKLIRHFEDITTALLTSPESYVKEALLSDILPICDLFGKERTNDIILSHLITYLNDKTFSLKISLIKSISGVAIMLGSVALEQYILPLLIQTLNDSEESVVIAALQSLISFSKVGLLRSKYYYDIASEISVLIIHPNFGIREYTMLLLIEMASRLSKPELYCMMYPIIRPFYDFDVKMTWESLFLSAKKPLTRNVFNLLCTWSLRSSKSFFWKHLPSKTANSFGNNTMEFVTKNYIATNYGFQTNLRASKSQIASISNMDIPLTTEDKNWIDKIKNLGISEAELWKLAALRPYVFRLSKMLSRRPETDSVEKDLFAVDQNPNGLPQTVFFDVDIVNLDNSHNTHVILRRRPSKDNILGEDSPNILQRPIDMNGSLILTPKSRPVINSASENIYIQFEPRISPASSDSTSSETHGQETRFRVTNSYDGKTESIIKFLKTMRVKPSLKSFKEFGETYTDSFPPHSFKNLNHLRYISSLSDHRPAAIVALSASNIRPFFVSGSDDGSLKIWDLRAIERGDSFKPIFTHELGSPITNVLFMTNYDTVIASTTDGSVTVFRLQLKNPLSNRDIHNIEAIRNFSYEQHNEYAVSLNFVNEEFSPLIITVTNLCNIFVLDARDMSIVHSIKIPPIYGSILSSSVSSDGNWLLCGTIRGVLLFWNITFKVLVKAWTFGDGTPIRQVTLFPRNSKKSEYGAIVVGGNQNSLFTLWNLTRVHVEQAVIVSGMNLTTESLSPKPVKVSAAKLDMNIPQMNYVCQSIYHQGNVYYADGLTSEFYKYNLKTKTNLPLLSSPSIPILEPHRSNLTNLTIDCSVTEVGILPNRMIQDRVTNFHTDLISCMSFAVLKDAPALISADNSGTIHVHSIYQ